MTRFGFALLVAPVLARRLDIQNTVQLDDALGAQSFAHLSEEDSLVANHALEMLAQLKKDANNVELQNRYREVIGEIEWEEDRAFLTSGVRSDDPPVMLGKPSTPGDHLSMAELLTGRLGAMSWFTTKLGRVFTGRRDFAIEDSSGQTQYMLDGISASLHSRMQISVGSEIAPRLVVRRAFSYLNPIAAVAGQFVYRVIRCAEGDLDEWDRCQEGEILYTITKDRFGRGALWGRDEYRVYTGTGGCRRHGYGVLSCHQADQIMYSLSAGLSDATFDTKYYTGNIVAIDGDGATGHLYGGEELDEGGLNALQVAEVTKASGSPRALNWPIAIAGLNKDVKLAQLHATMTAYEDSLTPAQWANFLDASIPAHRRAVQLINSMDPPQRALMFAYQQAAAAADFAGDLAQGLAMAYHLAKSLIWADSYVVTFSGGGGPTDDLLVSVMAAVQDLTREINAIRPAR